MPLLNRGPGQSTIGGNVTVVQPAAANLQAQVSQPVAAQLNATVVQAVAALLNATVSQGVAANLLSEVSQPVAANLNATVVQAAAANLNATVAQATRANLNANATLQVAGADNALGNPAFAQLTAGETHIGEVGGRMARISASKARPNDTTAYAVYDAIAESAAAGTVWTFTSMARASGQSGTIIGAMAYSSNVAAVHRMELDLYLTSITAINDNAEATQLIGNVASYVGTISFPALAKRTTNSTIVVAVPSSLPRMVFRTSGSANLFGIARTLDAFTPVANSTYGFILWVMQD